MTTFADLNTALVTIADYAKVTRTGQGTLASLSTTNKTTLVAAINELKAAIDLVSGASIVDDGVTNTTNAWSSSKIASELIIATNNAVTQLVDGAPAAKDTLNELITFITANEGSITTILANQNARVAVDIAQSFTGPQQVQGRANISAASVAEVTAVQTNLTALETALGSATIDFVANVNTALA